MDRTGLLEKFFREMFDIREGELGRALLMQLYIFLVISSLLIVKPVCNSLFLSQFGAEQLPNAFILVAIFAAAVSAWYTKLQKKIPLNRAIVYTLQISIGALAIFWSFLFFNIKGGVLYIFYVWVAIFAVISTSQFWILANLIFNSREAKRLFGFIGAGAIAGGIFGGYLTNFLAPLIGSENLLIICMVLVGACLPIVQTVWQTNGKDRTKIKFERQKQITKSADNPVKLIIKSRHLTLLAALVGISVLAAKLVDYQFSAIASERITDEDQLTAFFGFWLSNLNIISLIIQLFLTRRVVGEFGVGTSLFFLPASIFFGALAVLIHPALWSGILIKISDGSLKQSINRAGLELLALPIPLEIKNQAKTIIDVFVDSLATGIGGLLLIFMTYALNFSERQISLLIILLIAVWIYFVRHIREEYIQSFRSRIEKAAESPTFSLVDFHNESIFSGLIKILEGDEEKQIVQTLKMVMEIRHERLIPCFKKLIHSPSPAVRLQVLKNIYFYKKGYFFNEVQTMLFEENQDLKTEAMHYLFQHTPHNPIEMLRSYLRHEDYRIRGAALFCAAQESRMNRELRKTFAIREIVGQLVKEIPNLCEEEQVNFTKSNCARVIGAANIPELYPYLHIFLNATNTEILKAAIAAAARTAQKDFIPVLIGHLKNKELQTDVALALSEFGVEALEILESYLTDPAIDKEIRHNIPMVMAKIGTQRSVDILLEGMNGPEFLIRHEIIKALNHARRNYPQLKFNDQRITGRILEESKSYLITLAVLYKQVHQDISAGSQNSELENVAKLQLERSRKLLIRSLEERLDQNLERVFRLLGLKYPPDDIDNAYQGIRSTRPDLRANAIEFLDNLLEPNIKKMIIPILETTLADVLVDELLEDFKIPIPSEFECMVTLLKGDDAEVKISALRLIGDTKDIRYISFLGELVDTSDAKVKEAARFALMEMGILQKSAERDKNN